jgi:hypothetical protein
VTTPRPAASFCGQAASPPARVGNWCAESIGSQAVLMAARVSGRRPSPRSMPAHSLAWSLIVVSIEPAARAGSARSWACTAAVEGIALGQHSR